MKVAEDNNPSRECEDTKHSARNETRACHLRSCVKTFAEEDAEEAARNRSEQDYVFGLRYRHTYQQRYSKAKCRLDHVLAEDSPAHTPVQIKTLRRYNQACYNYCGSVWPATENGQAPIKIS